MHFFFADSCILKPCNQKRFFSIETAYASNISKRQSFSCLVSQKFGKDFIRVPLPQYRSIIDAKMSSEAIADGNGGDCKRRVVIIFCQPRSGSSLLSRCFDDVADGVRVYNEPEIFDYFDRLVKDVRSRQNGKSDKFLDEELKRVLLYFCKGFWSSENRRMVAATA